MARSAAAAATTLMRRLLLASTPPRLAPPARSCSVYREYDLIKDPRLDPAAQSCSVYREYDLSKDPREMISYLGDWYLTEQAMKHPGMDYRHWFVQIAKPHRLKKNTKEQNIDYFARILRDVLPDSRVCDLEKKIYKVVFDSENSGFGCEIDWDTADKLKGAYRIEKVSPDYYPDPKCKDYGGELVVDGKVVERPGPMLKMEDKEESA